MSLKTKSLTHEGTARVNWIVNFLFIRGRETVCYMKIYVTVLSLLKNCVLLFQKSERWLHSLHMKQETLLREFLGCIIDPSVLNGKSGYSMCQLVLEDHMLSTDDIHFGSAYPNVNIRGVKENLQKAYLATWKYQHLQDKMPVESPLLRYLSILTPDMQSTALTSRYLRRLAESTKIIDPNDLTSFHEEVHQYVIAHSQPYENLRVDHLWSLQTPLLRKLALSLLSIFYGAEVGRNFSLMG